MRDGADTKYGHLTDDHEWTDPDDDADNNHEPVVEVTRHTIAVDDRRDSAGEHGYDWLFNVEDATITGIYLGHWLEGRTQSDPMRSPPWNDVPTIIKHRLRSELGLDHGDPIPLDLPDYYTDEEEEAESA